MNRPCPLCREKQTQLFHQTAEKEFFRCPSCFLIFLHADHRLTPEKEKQRYDLHENDPQDKNYRNFLEKLSAPMLKLLAKSAHGLDYGCGPAPTLSLMFQEKGCPTEHYDPLYFPDNKLLDKKYDFVSCSETAEHFFDPHKEFSKLKKLLKPGGFLGIMTNIFEEQQNFAAWYYPKDPTHVCFYSKKTFEWIAEYFSLDIVHLEKNVIIFSPAPR